MENGNVPIRQNVSDSGVELMKNVENKKLATGPTSEALLNLNTDFIIKDQSGI